LYKNIIFEDDLKNENAKILFSLLLVQLLFYKGKFIPRHYFPLTYYCGHRDIPHISCALSGISQSLPANSYHTRGSSSETRGV
jgi:hypothetical protein